MSSSSPIVMCAFELSFVYHALPPRRARVASRLPATSQWQDTFPQPPGPSAASRLKNLHAAFPTSVHTLHILSLSLDARSLLATSQRKEPSRQSYASSSEALPLPLTPSSLPLLRDAVTLLYNTPRLTSPPHPDASLASLLPPSVRAHFGVDHIRSNSLVANLLRCGGEGPINRAGASLHMLRLLSVDIIAACIEEAPSITTSSLPLSGNIFLHPAASPPLCLPCHPAIALALANVANVACYISRDIFASASVTIHDMDTVYESHEGVTFELPHEATPTPDKAGASVAGPACKLLAEDVFQMSSCVLRAQLRAEGVAVTSTEARESLLAKLAPRLDEVQRRELGILHAAKEGDYRRAAELQKGRSRRGELLEELRRSEREGEWGKAVRLGGVIRGIEGGIMDVTAEPGSYQRDLDRDEWYRPNR